MGLPNLLLLLPLASSFDVPSLVTIWPLPRSFTNGSSTLNVAPSLRLVQAPESELLARAWKRALTRMFPWPYDDEPQPGFPKTDGQLATVAIAVASKEEDLRLGVNESYTLSITPSGSNDAAPGDWACMITAPTVWGALHGLTTLTQVIEPLPQREDGGRSYVIRAAPWYVADEPVLPYRGLMIDSSRHFLPVSAILRQVDALSMNKMNVLHWHSTDAESMPVSSENYPNLAAKGAFSPRAVFTHDDIRAIVAYARDRGVRVIAEFDMPGHNYAWSIDPNLTSLFVNCSDLYPIAQQYWVASFDPTNEDVYSFLDTFLGEMVKLFPDPVMHLGGDEVQYACWNQSKSIRDYMQKHNLNLTELYGLFEKRVHAIMASHGKTVQSWDEVFTSARNVLPSDAIVQVWRGVETLTAAVQSGFRAVLSAPYYLNGGFDMGGPQVMWNDIYANDPIPHNLTKEEEERVLGAEACIWGEEVNQFNIDGRVWFRASMLAERVWSLKGNYTGKMGKDVLARSIKQMCRLLRAGIKATPIDDRDDFFRRDLWAQCEVDLPPSAA